MIMRKPILVLIQSTDSPISQHLERGIWPRQYFSLKCYAEGFKVYYYTCDGSNMQKLMPNDVNHLRPIISPRIYGVMHLIYYIFLIYSSVKWRFKKNIVIRVIGVNIPIVPVMKFLSGKKIVMSYQFDWATGVQKDYSGIKTLLSNSVQRLAINSADHLICTMRWLANIAITRYSFDAKQITIIPNYVDMGLFKPKGIKKQQIVFAGRLHWSKGVNYLIEAFKLFAESFDGYTLKILGSGEEMLYLKDLAGSHDIEFTGSIPNTKLAEIFNESEIFVLPSVNAEGHSKALIEAMAAGCKCVASNVPGNRDVLQESDSMELAFESKNILDLAEKLKLATSLNYLNQYNFARANYSSSKCFAKEIDILKNYLIIN